MVYHGISHESLVSSKSFVCITKKYKHLYAWYTTRERCITISYHAIKYTVANAINVTYARCMMGRLMQYRRIFNGFPVFRLAAFSMAWYKWKYDNLTLVVAFCAGHITLTVRLWTNGYWDIKTKSDRKSSNFSLQRTKTLYQNNFKYITVLLHFLKANDINCYLK